MIAKAPEKGKYGSDTYGLLRYLFGPGRSNEHRDQHLVAAWNPEWLAGGAFATRYRGWMARLAREIDAPMTGHNVEAPRGHVYHLVLSVPRQDGNLGDARWRELIEEAIDRMGFGPDSEGRAGCRWVAVHHGPSKDGNDHVHLALNLVRGDGSIVDTYRDWPRWRAWCLDVERRYGLTPTSPANKTAPLRPTRAETEKATRQGRDQSSREYLRQVVRAAAAQASTAGEFLALVRQEGVRIEPRWSEDGQLAGYKLALPIDRSRSSPDGLVWFSGSKLARDLSAPKLTARWASAPAAPPPLPRDERDRTAIGRAEHAAAIKDAASATTQAHSVLTLATSSTLDTTTGNADASLVDAEQADSIAHATLDMMVATAAVIEGHDRGPLTAAAVAYERAAATPHRVQPIQWAPVAAELRTAARRLARVGVVSRRGNTGIAVAALLAALVSLLAEIAAWRQQTGQLQQAAAARHTIALLKSDNDIGDQGLSNRRVRADKPMTETTGLDSRRGRRSATQERARTSGYQLSRDPQSANRSR
ncbi:hypothetical protein JOF56_004167 [Kibdelosporangium banguiense]|uniref:MobA/VirD2-like nuclease domain-containing protein n=1 Tax=Kibdelosporangium banguiense TaxID=1365924 RepID=A0ABS4TH72_9PSEU|nr:hypothetical protein [Kibdelosporangium banguiense]MBP2323782.1 hypothetical protein [Kibdelosporangium banguiense]